MPIYPADPGNVFASDYHRRVAAHLPPPGEDPMPVENLFHRMVPDASTEIDGAMLERLVRELHNDKVVEQVEGEYRLTKAGLKMLTGPSLVRREVRGPDGEREVKLEEDPPKEGRDLERAEEVNAEREAADREIEKEAKANRIEELKAEIATLEEE